MICLDNTDVIEGGAATDAVVEYTMYGLVGTTFTQLAAGVMNTTLTTALYTAGAAVSVVSIILVNTHSAAVAVTLRLDPADGGNPRYLIPKTVSLGAGYSLHTDGARISVMDTSGQIIHGYPSPLGPTKGGTGLASYTKGDLLYASAANVLGALGIGTANYKLFANAAGDLPEWAVGMKTKDYSYNLATPSGSQAVAGAGFRPSQAIVIYGIVNVTMGIGFSDGTTHRALLIESNTALSGNIVQAFMMAVTGAADYQIATLAFSADGGTLTWTKTGGAAGTLYFTVLWLR